MLKRYDIMSLDDLRAAAQHGSDYIVWLAQVVPLRRENS
jgi:hypothetical protein